MQPALERGRSHPKPLNVTNLPKSPLADVKVEGWLRWDAEWIRHAGRNDLNARPLCAAVSEEFIPKIEKPRVAL